MVWYIIKKIFWMLPTIVLLSLIVFFLTTSRHTDPIDQELGFQFSDRDDPAFLSEYEKVYVDRRYDLPDFYISITPRYYPDHINSVSNPDERNTILLRIEQASKSGKYGFLDRLPRFRWNGVDNQYHHWVSSILRLEFGNSIVDGKPSQDKIFDAFWWTLILLCINIFYVIIISFPLGVFLAKNKDSYWERVISGISLVIYTMPVFWIATLAIIFFTTNEYGQWTNIFPSVGIWSMSSSDSIISTVWENMDRLVLPVIILVLPDVAYLTKMIKNSVIEESAKPYIVALKSKGLSQDQVYMSHVLKNSLGPTITLLSGAIPGALAGSLVIEVIFNIPGMGRLLYDGIIHSDWNVVFPVIILASILTMIFFIIADLLIHFIHPRIELD